LEVFVQELNEASQANEMTRDEAERSNLAIKAGILSIRALLLDMRDRKGWKALGYASFDDYGKAELGYERRHLYELASAAEVEKSLTSVRNCAQNNIPASVRNCAQNNIPEMPELLDSNTQRVAYFDSIRSAIALLSAPEETQSEIKDELEAGRYGSTPSQALPP
jgi:hypothetical protein